jgi:metal-responsive CopG/Arc/MetJ family transcriptional regulator
MSDMQKNTRISVRVDQSLHQQLTTFAQTRHQSEAEIVRAALKCYFQAEASEESCLDLASRLGLLGSIEGLPADLSTNPAYFDGFGGQ